MKIQKLWLKGVIDKALKIFDNPSLLQTSVKAAKNPPSLSAASKKKKVIGFFFKQKENSGNQEKIANGLKQAQEIHNELINEDHSSKIFRSDNFLVRPQENFENNQKNSLNFEEKSNGITTSSIDDRGNYKENNETVGKSQNLTTYPENMNNEMNNPINTINSEHNGATLEPRQENNIGFLSLSEKMDMTENLWSHQSFLLKR